MSGEGPDGEGEPRSLQRIRPEEVQHIGHAEQGHQEKQGLQRLPGKNTEEKNMGISQMDSFIIRW